jgi:large subunit ribosomal protein L21
MYAIVENGGKQYRVSPEKTIKVEKLPQQKGESVTIDKVLLVAQDDRIVSGSPYISGAKVIATVENNGKDRKVLVYKQRPRKGYRRLRGHRQQFTSLKIMEIVLEG